MACIQQETVDKHRVQHRRISEAEGQASELFYTSMVASSYQRAVWRKGRLIDLAWEPNRQTLAVGSSLGIDIYDTDGYHRLCKIPTTEPIRRIAFCDQGASLVAVVGKQLLYWPGYMNESKAQLLALLPRIPIALTFSADASHLAIENGDMTMIYQVNNGRLLTHIPSYTTGTRGSLAFAPDNQHLAIAHGSTFQVWDYAQQCLCTQISPNGALFTQVSYAANSEQIFTIADDRLDLWSLDGELISTLQTNQCSPFQHMAVAPDGRLLATATNDQVDLWQLDPHLPIRQLTSFQSPATSLVFDPQAQLLAAATCDTLRIWDPLQQTLLQEIDGYCDRIASVACMADGNMFAAVAGQAHLWQGISHEDQPRYEFNVHRETLPTSDVVFSPDGKLLAVATDAQIQVRDVDSGALVSQIDCGVVIHDTLTFTEQGHGLFTVAADGIAIWRIRDGLRIAMLPKDLSDAHVLACTSDGQLVALARGQQLQLWSVQHGRLLNEFKTHLDIDNLTISLNGSLLAVASSTHVQIWQLLPQSARLLNTLNTGAQRLVFTPAGTQLALTTDNQVQIHDTYTGELLYSLYGHTEPVSSLSFSADGRKLLTGSYDGTVRLWDITASQS